MPTVSADIDTFLTSANAAAARTAIGAQASDSDLTAYAGAADAAARRALIGAVGTAAEITDALQGAEADPTKIGAEYMPATLTFDYIGVGEVPTAALPEGTIARVGTELRIHDGSTAGGIAVGSTIENVVPYHRASGTAVVIPFGQTNSICKQAGSYYWHELARVKVPGSEVIDGNTLTIAAQVRMKSNGAITSLQRYMLLVPAEIWDNDATFFGATPANSTFEANTPTLLAFIYTAASSQDSLGQFKRAHTLSYSGGQLSASSASAGTYTAGYDFTGAAAFVGTVVTGLTGTTRDDATDLELVLVVRATNTATDYRVYDYTVEASAAAP